MTDDNLIYYGGAVKVLDEGRVGGYLVRFGDEATPDLEGDFFTKDTILGISTGDTRPVYYQHGFDPVFKYKSIGVGVANIDDVGVWFEAQLEMRDEYERSLMELAKAGKLGWSSGAAGHLVDKELVGKSFHIKSWPIAEASLTPTPAEPRNAAISVKSLYDKLPVTEPETIQEDTMTDEVKAPEVKQEQPEIDFKALIDEAVKQAMESVKAEQPKPVGGVKVVEDEADRAARLNPFKPTEFFKAVYNAEVQHTIDKRLLPLKASGINEAIPSQGGFLVQQDIAAGINENMWGIGKVLSRFAADIVSGNGMKIRAVDETSRAAGSRMGGVRGYWLAEAAQATSSQPKFREINLDLKKVAALVYCSDEMLEDEAFMGTWISRSVPNELRFLVEDSIIDGTGIGMPLGILQSGSLVSATRTDASEVDALDIGRMMAARYQGVDDYVWFINSSVMPQLMQMSVGGSGYQAVFLPPGGLSQKPYGVLQGYPVIETEYNPYLGTVGDILLASPSQYALITKGGVQAASSIHVKFDYFETAFRFQMRVDGQPLWASAVTAFDGTASISPFVALAATT